MRIGITGATGVLGRAVMRHWTAAWQPFEGDVCDLDALRRWAGQEFDAVLHFAALVPVGDVEKDPLRAFEVNVRGTWNVLESLRSQQPWVFVASSSHAREPSGLYGVTKRMAEDVAFAFGGRVCVGRIFSFSAPGQASSYLLPSLVRRIRESGSAMEVRGGNNVRDFLTVRHIADAIATLYGHDVTGRVEIGSGHGVTVLEAARRLAVLLGRGDLEIFTNDDSETALVADPSELLANGWSADGALEELLEEMARS